MRKKLLGIRELSAVLGWSVRTLYRKVEERKMPPGLQPLPGQPRHRLYWSREAVEEWLGHPLEFAEDGELQFEAVARPSAEGVSDEPENAE